MMDCRHNSTRISSCKAITAIAAMFAVSFVAASRLAAVFEPLRVELEPLAVIAAHGALRAQVFLGTYNSALLEEAVVHYRTLLGHQTDIVLLDGGSDDDFVARAHRLGLRMQSWAPKSGDSRFHNERDYVALKNITWKSARGNYDWVIVADVDEWLHVTASDLLAEAAAGTSVLNTQGFDVIMDSRSETLADIDLHPPELRGCCAPRYSKSVCFNPNAIDEIHFSMGCHTASPSGNVKYSERSYVLAHMSMLGAPYLQAKHRKWILRRNPDELKAGFSIHYKANSDAVADQWRSFHSTANGTVELVSGAGARAASVKCRCIRHQE